MIRCAATTQEYVGTCTDFALYTCNGDAQRILVDSALPVWEAQAWLGVSDQQRNVRESRASGPPARDWRIADGIWHARRRSIAPLLHLLHSSLLLITALLSALARI